MKKAERIYGSLLSVFEGNESFEPSMSWRPPAGLESSCKNDNAFKRGLSALTAQKPVDLVSECAQSVPKFKSLSRAAKFFLSKEGRRLLYGAASLLAWRGSLDGGIVFRLSAAALEKNRLRFEEVQSAAAKYQDYENKVIRNNKARVLWARGLLGLCVRPKRRGRPAKYQDPLGYFLWERLKRRHELSGKSAARLLVPVFFRGSTVRIAGQRVRDFLSRMYRYEKKVRL